MVAALRNCRAELWERESSAKGGESSAKEGESSAKGNDSRTKEGKAAARQGKVRAASLVKVAEVGVRTSWRREVVLLELSTGSGLSNTCAVPAP